MSATLTSRGLCGGCSAPLPHPGNCRPEWHAGPRPMCLPGVEVSTNVTPLRRCRECGQPVREGRSRCGACLPKAAA